MIFKFFFPSTIHNFLAAFVDRDISTAKEKSTSTQSGQTSVEYILLLVVVMFMIITIMRNVKNRLIAQQNPCPITDKSLGCTISRAVSTFGTSDPNFRYFQVRR